LLHAAARQIMQQHDHLFPQMFKDIVALPGIGPSTAGAIASACFNAPYPVLDANVKRVLRRWHNLPEISDGQLWQYATQALEQSGDSATWNQAMMELGACRCQARQAVCDGCPLEPHCQSAHQPIIAATKAKSIRNLHWRIHIHHHPQQGVWLTKRASTGVWGGLWTPPIESYTPVENEQPDLIHQLTHRRLHLYAFTTSVPPSGKGKWVTTFDGVALPTGIKKLFVAIQVADNLHRDKE